MDRREPLVSIVMPIYNSETYLDEAILSIIHQTYQNWELLVINEFGSNEEGKRIINRYAAIDSRIRLIQNSERLGIAESLNEGLRQAKGEYIARMDGDDISLPKRIEKQVEFMEENKDILLCGVQVEVFGSEKWDWKLETDSAQIRTDALFYSPCVHPTILFRRDVIDKYNIFYNKDYKASEDYDFFIRVLKFGEIANLKEILFKYRLYSTNATYMNNKIGFKIYSDVMERRFHKLEIDFSRQEVDLLSVHYSLKGLEGVEVLEKMVALDLLLKNIFYVLYNKDKKSAPYLFKTLHRRFKESYDWLDNTCKYFDKNKAESIYKNSVFYHDEFYVQTKFASSKPKVSVLLPLYNSEKYIAETLWSLFDQTFSDFEVLVLNEYGSSKEGLEVVKMFEDDRIRIIQNKEKLGLADSLNLGIREAKGEYLARIDGDDLARSDRFALQVEFLDKNREYGLVGSLQHHFGINTDYIHNVPEEHKDILAGLIYDCLVCHSTIMMRKKVFVDNNLFYDKTKQAEDYELWTRACKIFKFYNIPEVLGEYRVGEDNITKGKLVALSKESGELAYKNIRETLGVEVPTSHILFLSGWINEFESLGTEEYKNEMVIEQKVLEQMWDANNRIKYYDADALLRVINKRWRNITNTWEYNSNLGEILPIDRLFKVYNVFEKKILEISDSNNTETGRVSFKERIKDILRFLYKPFKHGIQYRIRRQIWDLDGHLHESTYDIKNTVWDIEGRIKGCIIESIGNDKESNSAENLYDRLNDLEVKMNTMMEFMELKLSAQEVKTNSNIVKSKDSLSEQLDARVWKAETNLGQQIDGRIWKAEGNISDYVEKHTEDIKVEFTKVHRHLEFSYSDIFVLLDKNIENTSGAITLDTEYPIAYESNDYLVPHGTVRDDTRYPRFIHACEMYFKDREKLAFVDLGCSSGGIVLDALLRGHEAVGLEGSDESFKQQRAQWRIIPKNLFTCDITKPFTLKKDGKLKEFDVISAWEVLEHIKEEDMPMLLENIKKHLNKGGIFIGTISNWDDIDEETGVNWHVNLHPYEWWRDIFAEAGFDIITETFSPYDLARGTVNPPHVYDLPAEKFYLDETFYIVAKKRD
ncbi:glycosyltransferase, group 2 family protein [Lachnospiraceae bacterium oral taxon 082 str. F0431]|nr:glycosyltransferase, group 2 family protein [Lachnospiraceae bacterium oral taxon 082 str. F0431]